MNNEQWYKYIDNRCFICGEKNIKICPMPQRMCYNLQVGVGQVWHVPMAFFSICI